MKLNTLKYFAVGCVGLAIVGCQTDSMDSSPIEDSVVKFDNNQSIEGRYIVVYDNSSGKIAPMQKTKSSAEYSAQMRQLKSTFLQEFEAIGLKDENVIQTYGHAIKGFSADLSSAQLASLKKDPRVLYVEQDKVVSLAPPPGKGPGGGGSEPPAGETLPPSTTRVGGGNSASLHTAWVIDTGVDLDHPDLNVDVARSASFLSRDNSPDDQNGHGTHVAGTIAAIKGNGIGSVGVAPGNLVVAVRVLDRRGSGTVTSVVGGIDYVKANAAGGDVANMSLGGGVSTSIDNAVLSAAGEGVIFALAAGNESDDANNHSPARVGGNSSTDNIYTISAMDDNDVWAYFSNFGDDVEYCAPGVRIYSLWKDGGYNTISGTSMATPHAAGVLLFGKPNSSGVVENDPDQNPDPIIHI